MSRPYRLGPLTRPLAGCLIGGLPRSCLITMVLMLFTPLLLFLGGGAVGIYFWARNAPAADAFRAIPPCSASALAPSTCFVRTDAVVESVTSSRGRYNPMGTQDLILRMADGEHRTQVDVWVTQLHAMYPGQRVAVRLDQGKITEISTATTTFETRDSPVAASTTPRNYAIAFLVFALIVAIVMVLSARKQWPDFLRDTVEVWRGTGTRSSS